MGGWGRALALVGLAGCSPGLEGFWIGRLQCGGFPYDWELTLEKESSRSFLGDGEQTREFTNVEGKTTTVIITFDATVDLDKPSGSQTADASFACTSEQTIETSPGGGDSQVVAEGCAPLRFRDYQVDWDGEEIGRAHV